MKRAWFVAVACAAAAVIGLGSASCGSSDNGDGGVDGNVQDGNDDSCVSLNGCNDGGSCSTLGKTCGANGDCCSGNCAGGSCQIASCTADNGTCAKNADCCSGTCT